MTSGVGTPGMPPGDGAVKVDRRTVGTDAPATGSARPVIGVAALLLTLLCVVLAFVFGVANGLLVLATVFLAVFLWAIGAHRRTFWQ